MRFILRFVTNAETNADEATEVVDAWARFLAEQGGDWETLVAESAPKSSGCGVVYELGKHMDRTGEDLAIADMRALDVSEPHFHTGGETEIYFVLQGTGAVVMANEVYEVGPQDVLVTPPEVAHYVIPHDSLVLGVVNSPPFEAANYVALSTSNASVGYDADLYALLSKRTQDNALKELLADLTLDLHAWASVLLVPNRKANLLAARARYALPDDWAATGNFLDSNSMNARVFNSQQELIENGIDEDGPPTDKPVTRHRMTAAAALPVPGVGTLEVLADSEGYEFDDERIQQIRDATARVLEIL